MIPLRDENPTHRRPVITVAILIACVAVFLFVQPSATRSVGDELQTADIVEEIEFSYEYAAIPCELIQGRSLAISEIRATVGGGDVDACDTDLVDPVAGFPGKSVWLSVLISAANGSAARTAHAERARRSSPRTPAGGASIRLRVSYGSVDRS